MMSYLLHPSAVPGKDGASETILRISEHQPTGLWPIGDCKLVPRRQP